MSTTIGEVNINLRMSLAQFKQDVRSGSAEANTSTRKMADDIKTNSSEAKGSIALLGEEIGVHVPRHLRTLISNLPGIGSALAAAFSAIAVVALAEVVVQVIGKTKEFAQELGGMGKEAQEAYKKLIDGNKQALQFADQLKAKYRELALIGLSGAAKDAAQKTIDTETLADASTRLNQILARQGEIEKEIAANGISAGQYQGYVTLAQTLHLAEDPAKKLNAELADLKKEGQDVAEKIRGLQETHLEHTLNADADAAKRAVDDFKKLADLLFKVRQEMAKAQPIVLSAGAVPNEIEGPLDLGRRKGPSFNDTFGAGIDKQNTETLKAAKTVYDATRTAAEQYAQEIDDLNKLLAQGTISQQTYDRAVKMASEKLDGSSKAWKEFGSDVGNTIKQAALFGRSWGDALKSILFDVVQLILKMTLLKELNASAAAGGSTGGFFTSLLGGLFGGGKAEGGPLDPGHWYIAGEKGPEPIWGGGSGAFAAGYPKSRPAEGKSVTYNIHMPIHGVTDVDGFKKSQSQIMADLQTAIASAHRRNR